MRRHFPRWLVSSLSVVLSLSLQLIGGLYTSSMSRMRSCMVIYPRTSICLLLLAFLHLPSDHDSALFLRRGSAGITVLLLYVDDMTITGDDASGISELQAHLHRHFEKSLGPLRYFLGLKISDTSGVYYLSQPKYASDLLSSAGLTDFKTAPTPLDSDYHLTPMDGVPLDDPTLYRQLVGSLIYLTVTRPDIAYAIHIVSQFMSAPRTTHHSTVIRILRYIKGTFLHGLHYSARSSLVLTGYSDVNWAGDPSDHRSTTRFCFFLGDSLISWRNKKQTVVSRSSAESEYRALADTTAELLWLRWFLADLGVPQSSATIIHCDSQSSMKISTNDVFHEYTKHIEIDCHIVRYHVTYGNISLSPISSADQTADGFTKPHLPSRFQSFLSKLKLGSTVPP
ncbi:uncharacterized mitochondrial protein AtMg00810-like [Andrographis paniculata]|uniref:uncharacterized mitochondrial protein AtMg00810-like n=1 Tax=Andrographis paniculata TaxID=175694 RepID=UPI0021E7F713|nr:uncharacterized mitochondrial protein AtMg00810-like [Andrographis paniculata]